MAVARNVIANTVGTAVLVVASAATTVLSFRLAGSEQFGLIGFYFTLHGIVAILDTGLGPGIVREVAHARSGEHGSGLGSILFTFQGIYAGITGATTLVLVAASSFMATAWLSARTISAGEIQTALILAALIIGLQRLRTVYSVFLEGLEQQVLVNFLQSGAAVLRALVVLGAMIADRADRHRLSRRVPPHQRRGSAGHGLVRMARNRRRRQTAVLVAHGPAAVAFSADQLARGRGRRTAPRCRQAGGERHAAARRRRPLYVHFADLSHRLKAGRPERDRDLSRLSASIRRADVAEARRVYFAAAQTVSCIVAAFGLGAAFFGSEALFFLTGSLDVARDYHWLFAILALGYGLNGLCQIPNALRLSEGDPGTALWSNLAAAALYLPAIILLTPAYGVLAPAVLWLATNVLLFAVMVARAHRDALAGCAWSWLWSCVIRQFVVTAAVYAMTKADVAADKFAGSRRRRSGCRRRLRVRGSGGRERRTAAFRHQFLTAIVLLSIEREPGALAGPQPSRRAIAVSA